MRASLAADWRVAGDNVRFGVTEILAGLVPAGGTSRLVSTVGLSKAKETPGEPLAGRARAGLITGIIGAVAGVVLTIVIFAAVPWDEIDSDPPDGVCDEDRFLQDPDC